LEAFGSIQKLRKATAAEITTVSGVSVKLAADIVEYLAKRV
jgi:excinuclease UvrABC nuclease subunit